MFRGAGGGEVTGSAYLVQTCEAKILVDWVLFQGRRKVENYNRIPMKGAFEKLNAVVLTHAHLDHTGPASASDACGLFRADLRDASHDRFLPS
jgi:predicted metal-dependent RNase